MATQAPIKYTFTGSDGLEKIKYVHPDLVEQFEKEYANMSFKRVDETPNLFGGPDISQHLYTPTKKQEVTEEPEVDEADPPKKQSDEQETQVEPLSPAVTKYMDLLPPDITPYDISQRTSQLSTEYGTASETRKKEIDQTLIELEKLEGTKRQENVGKQGQIRMGANGPYYVDANGFEIAKEDFTDEQREQWEKAIDAGKESALKLKIMGTEDTSDDHDSGVKHKDIPLTNEVKQRYENHRKNQNENKDFNYHNQPEYVDLTEKEKKEFLENKSEDLNTLLEDSPIETNTSETKKYIDLDGDGIPDQRAMSQEEWDFFHRNKKSIQQSEKDRKEFEKSMPKVTMDIVTKDEGRAVKMLKELYKDWTDSNGKKFKFEVPFSPSLAGVDKIKITAPNGISESFKIDMWSKNKREDVIRDINNFMLKNSMSSDMLIEEGETTQLDAINEEIDKSNKQAEESTEKVFNNIESTDAKIKELEHRKELLENSYNPNKDKLIEEIDKEIQIVKGVDPKAFTDELLEEKQKEQSVTSKVVQTNLMLSPLTGPVLLRHKIEEAGGWEAIWENMFGDDVPDDVVRAQSAESLLSNIIQQRAIQKYIADKKKNDKEYNPNETSFQELQNRLLEGDKELLKYVDQEIEDSRWWRDQKNIMQAKLDNGEISQAEFDEAFNFESGYFDYKDFLENRSKTENLRANVDERLRKEFFDKESGERKADQGVSAAIEEGRRVDALMYQHHIDKVLTIEQRKIEKEIRDEANLIKNSESELEKLHKKYNINYIDEVDKDGKKTGQQVIDDSHIKKGVEKIYNNIEGLDKQDVFDKTIADILSKAPSMEEQEKGAAQIKAKYSIPSQEEINKEFEKIKSKYDLTTVKGSNAAQKEWTNYQNNILKQEQLMQKELNEYIESNSKVITDVNLKLKEYQDEQLKLRNIAEKKANKYIEKERSNYKEFLKLCDPHLKFLRGAEDRMKNFEKSYKDLGDLAIDYQDKLGYLLSKKDIAGQYLEENMKVMSPKSALNIRNSFIDFFIGGAGDVMQFLTDVGMDLQDEAYDAVVGALGIGPEGEKILGHLSYIFPPSLARKISPFSDESILANINKKTGKDQTLWRMLRANWKEKGMEDAARRTMRTRQLDDLRELEGGWYNNLDEYGAWMGEGFVQNLPVLSAIMVSGGWAIPMIMAQGVGRKYGTLLDDQDLYYETGGLYGLKHSNADMYINALVTGVAEGAFEYVTAGIWGRTVKSLGWQAVKQAGGKITKEAVDQSVKRGFANELKRMLTLKNFGKQGVMLTGEMGSESIAEGLTQLAENLADIHVLGKADVHWSDGIDAAAIQGAGIAGMLQSPRVLNIVMKPFQSKQSAINNKKRFEQLEEIHKRLNKLKYSDGGFDAKNKDEIKELSDKYQQLVEEIQQSIEYDIKRVDVLPDSQKKILLEIERRNWKDNKEIAKIKADNDLTKEERKKKLDEIYARAESREKRKNQILDQYTPNIVDKHYKNRVETIKAMMKQAEKYGGPIVSIVEMGKNTFKDAVKKYELDQKDKTEAEVEEVISQNEYLIEGLQDIINDPNSTEQEIKDAKEELKLAQGQVKLKNILNSTSNGVMQPIMGKNKKGQTVIKEMKILLNKDAIVEGGMFNTAAHEFIHAVWANTLKFDPGLRRVLGRQVKKILEGDGVIMSESTRLELNKRVANYDPDKQGEEMMAIVSEMMLEGRIKLNDGPIQKLKDHFRRFAQDNLGYDIRFNNTNDVRNFLKDYHRSIEKNKPNKAIAKMMAKGANGKIFKDKRTNKEIEGEQNFSEAIRKNLKSNPDLRDEFDLLVQNEDGSSKHTSNSDFKNSPEYTEGYYKIMESKLLDGLITQGMTELGLPGEALRDFTRQVKEKIAERYLTNFNLDKNNSLFGWLTGVSGGAGRSIIYRAKGDVMKQYVKEGKAKETSIDRVVGDQGTLADVIQGDKDLLIDQIENADMSPALRNELSNDIKGLKMVMDLLGFPESTKKSVIDAVVEANAPITIITDGVPVQNLTYRNIRDLLLDIESKATTEKRVVPTGPLFGVLNAIAAEFGVDPLRILAKQDLNAEQRRAAQMFILNKSLNSDGTFNKDIIEALPEGQDRSGRSTGVANTKLGQFYIKGERAKMKAGATAAGLATQTKRTDITKNEFLDLFGINPDGTFRTDTKADGAIRELIVQIAQLSANQSIRVEAVKNQVESADAVARLADGTSKAMYSESVEGQNEIQEKTSFIIESTKLTPAKIFQEIGISDPLAAIKALNKGEFVWTGKLKDQAIEVIQEYIKRDPSLYYVFRDSMAFGMNRSTFGLTKIFESLAPEGNFEKIFNRFEYKDSRKKIKRKGKDVKNKSYGKLNKAKIFKKDGKFYFKLVGGEVVSYKRFVEIQESTQEALFNIFDVTLDLGPTKSWFLKYFVGDSSSNMNGLIRTSARLIGVPINSDGSIDYNTPIREEHMLPQNNVGRMLTRSFLIAKGDPFLAMKIVIAAYGQMPLRMEPKGSGNTFKDTGNLNDHDGMVGAAGYADSMPDFFWDVIAPRIADGSLDYLPPGLASIVRYTKSDIDLNGYQLFNGQTITEFFGVNVDNFYDLSKEEQVKIVKEQNRRIEEILAGNKEIKVAKKEIKVEAKNSVKRMEDKSLSSFSKKFDKNKTEIDNGKNLQIQKRELDNSISSKKPFKIRGLSVFDFDDTLSYTKSGVRVTMPNADGKPKPRRKVIFLAGGAGSGKGNVIKKLGLEGMGFKIVNSDISLEWLKENSGLPADMRNLTKEQRSELGKLGAQARKIARGKMMKYKGKGDGVVVDGTGGSVKQMKKLVAEFEAKGYDVSMLFVDTSLDTAIERNRTRKERSLLDTIVKRNHEAVQGNKDTFKEMFGDNFMEVNTDNLTQESAMPPVLVDQINKLVSGYEKRRIDATEFASQGDQLLREGAEFDFTEFDQVIEGTPGPLLGKALERAKKYGTKDIFVLTARTQKSAEAIQQFLKSQGLNIPIENITGLADSTSEAKAQWFLEKFAEGYNDMYFTDDALQNVEAVKQVLDQLDVKSDVVQAKAGKVNRIIDTSNSMESKMVEPDPNDPNRRDPIDKEFNDMLERKKGIDSDLIVSEAEGKKRGSQPNIIRFLKSLYIPPSAEDFKGLLYYFVGKGKQGDADLKWFKEKLFDPFAKGIRSWNAYKQNMVNEYQALKKKFKNVANKLNKKIPGTVFTNDTAIRVYLFDKAGHDIPGISEAQKQQLIDYVNANPDIKAFADGLSTITRSKDGYPAPTENWAVSSIPGDMNNLVNKIGRKQFLQEWINMKNIIFSKDNLNKIEAVYGKWFREALDNILYRMENGGNRVTSPDSTVNRFTEWINGSVGAIMFFNMRSALLQTISTVNFINWSDNNIFKAAAAFANQPQFWKDFAMLFNSDQLKQRRKGLQTDVSASELQKTFAEGGATPRAVINYLLQIGFTPTQIADSFAIAMGGASMYRNRYNKYIKEGMDPKQAHDQAMLDFQEIAEETQQSSREDLISQQQASVLGRMVLAFQNVTMQMGRLTKKAISDLMNGRGDWKTNVSKIIYYAVVQNIVFAALQTALAFLMWGGDEEEIESRTNRTMNQALDSFLRGTGLYGALLSTLKNTIIQWHLQKDQPYGKREKWKIVKEMLGLSPPIGAKIRKIVNAFDTELYNKGVGEKLGWSIENPELNKWANIIEAVTNLPLARILNKANNLEEALTGDHLLWQRVAMTLGWNRWDVGVKDEELEKAKEEVKEERKEKKKIEKEKKKEEEKKKKEEKIKKEEEEKKEKGIKTVRCSGIRSNGERCGNVTETSAKSWKCVHHKKFVDGSDTDGDGKKEYRCTATKSNGQRCKNKTENTNKRCYAHQ